MIILGIETSCDETALALIETRGTGTSFECRVMASLIHSQADLHSPYGGVFPTLAKREHEKNLPILLEQLLKDHQEKPGVIAVTEGPGLEPALWTGIVFAEKLSKEWSVPIIPINHMEGHVVGSLLQSDVPSDTWQTLKVLETPALAFLVSGGHTELVKVEVKQQEQVGSIFPRVLRALRWSQSSDPREHAPYLFSYTLLGQTKDDAVGEAFDKAARLIGLPYPGGPKLSQMATEARKSGIIPALKLPRPMITSGDLNFSFSGLKTAVLYAVRDAEKAGVFDDTFKKGLAREFEDAAIETLETKLRTAVEETGARTIIVGGGVSANALLRERLAAVAHEYDARLYLPSSHISGDNALMIALAGAFHSPVDRALKAHGTKRLHA